MRLPNVHRLTFFSRPRRTLFIKGNRHEVGFDFWLTLNECPSVFGFNPNGANFYIALTRKRLSEWTPGNLPSTLNGSHRTQFFELIVNELKHGSLSEATIVLSLEPKEPITQAHKNPYDTVRQAHETGYLSELAQQLQSYQMQYAPKTLRIVIRYASEMNSNEAVYSHQFISDPSCEPGRSRPVHMANPTGTSGEGSMQ